MREPLLLLPGALCDARLWAHQLHHLADVATPVFADLPDVGDVAGMAEGLLGAAPPRFALAGLSLGGVVAFEMLRRAPERVSRLALVATTAELDPPPLRTAREASMAKVRAQGLEPQLPVLLPLLLGPGSLRDAALVAEVRAMAMAVGGERYARQVEAIKDRPDPAPVLGAIACPTLVLCGEDDAVTTSASHAALAAAIAGARLEVVGAAAHLAPMERPAAVTAHLRAWLSAR